MVWLSGAGPSAKIAFKAARSGNHDVWLRAYAQDDGSDSVHVDLDGSASTYHFYRSNLARWVWVKVRTVKLNAGGQHTLALWAREDNLRIDKVVIQPEGRGTPSSGAAQSNSTSGTSSGTSGSTGGSSTGSTHTQGSNGVLTVEAESAATTASGNSKWAVASQSGVKHLHKQGGGWYSSSGTGPSAKFPFKAVRGGNHDVWLRAYAQDDGSDSVHVDLDGSASTYHFYRSNLARWVWVKVRTVKLSAGGQHTLALWAREDNLRIDKVVIQPEGRGTPSDSGTSGGSTGGSTSSGTSGSTGSSSSGSTGDVFWIGRDDGIEAESAFTTSVGNSKWTIASQSGTSGGKYLRKQGGGWYRSSGAGPSAKFPFKAHFPGTYDVWLRAFAQDGGSDSLHIDFDGRASTYHFSSNNHGRWVWVKVRTIVANPNYLHTLALWAREDNLRIDKIAFRPAGSGGPSDATSFRQAFHEAAVRLKNQVDQQLRSKNSVYLGDSNYITSVSLKQARDIEGFTVGIDISGFGLHGEFQMSVLMDVENHEFGFSGSLEGGAQNPDLPGAGVFANAVFGDDGLRMDSVVSGYSVNANASASIPGLPVGVEVVRSLPVGQGGAGLTETGIRYELTNSSVVPASAGVSHSTAAGWVIDLGPVANAFASGLDTVYGIAAQAQANWDSLTGSNPSSSGSSGGGSDGNGNGGNDWSHTSCCYNGETGPRSANKIPQQPSNGVLSIEAESLSTKALDNSKWAVTSQSGASGRVLRKQGGGFYSYSGSGPGARLVFNASRGGSHDVWLRTYAPDDGSDSLHIDLDGSASTYHFSRGNLARWAWVKVRTVRLSAGGQHTLTLWAREDNLRIDKVVIQPTGRGAPG